MATALKLKSDIKKLKAAINSKATPKSFLPKLKNQLERAEGELKSLKEAPKGGKPKKSTSAGTEKTLTALEKLVNKKKYSVYKGRGVDLKKDAGEGAFQTGRRVSKGLKSNQYGSAKENKGNVYYEYRPNRLDVKQPKKKQTYPKLEDGGMMAKGGELKNKLKDLKAKTEGFFPRIEPNDENSYYLWETPKSEKISHIIQRKSVYGDVGSEYFVYDKSNKFIGAANSISGFSNIKPIRITKADISFADGGMMAKGGEVRYKLKGSNFGQQIENGQKFKALISKVHANQTGENKYPENFIKEIAYTGKIVKSDGSNYLKDYAYKGTLTKFEFLDDKDFIEALKYVDRPAIRKFEEGGMFEKPIAAVMDNHGNIKSQEKLEKDLEYLRQAYEDKMITKDEYDKEKNEIEQQIQSLRNKEKGGYMAFGGELHRSEEKYAEGGQTKNFNEREFKDILDEALEHLYMGLNKIEGAMRYLEVRGQAGMKNPFAAKIGLSNLKESIEKIDEYTSKK